MSKNNVPFRFDYVGSFLRPDYLKKARADFEKRNITKEELTEIENKAITDLVKKQKELGYKVITDGEFRRATWHLDFMWGFNGVAHKKTEKGVAFHGEPALIDDTWLTGKISADNHPFVEHYKFIKTFEDENTVAKQTIPAPAQFFQQMIIPANIETTRKFYATDDELITDIANGYKKVINDLYNAGCRNIQFDDCTWGVLVAEGSVIRYGKENNLEDIKEKLLKVNNLAIEGKPEDLVITTHICRGNYHSAYFSSGAYDSVAEPLFGRENVDAYYLEFDDEPRAGTAPLTGAARRIERAPHRRTPDKNKAARAELRGGGASFDKPVGGTRPATFLMIRWRPAYSSGYQSPAYISLTYSTHACSTSSAVIVQPSGMHP